MVVVVQGRWDREYGPEKPPIAPEQRCGMAFRQPRSDERGPSALPALLLTGCDHRPPELKLAYLHTMAAALPGRRRGKTSSLEALDILTSFSPFARGDHITITWAKTRPQDFSNMRSLCTTIVLGREAIISGWRNEGPKA
jgi:hypothetical protein